MFNTILLNKNKNFIYFINIR